MRVDKLAIDRFKNLENFVIDFDEKALTTVILGRNGTGKSNLLEALIIIFRDLDLGEPPAFKYRLDYRCRGYTVHVDADPERPARAQVHIRVGRESKYGEDEIPYQRFAKETDRRYLPSYVFGYYSGPSNRMEAHFEKHQKRFYDQLIKGQGSEKPLRPLLYARLVHSQFALLAFFNERDDEILNFLSEHLGIEAMDSVLFVMRQPPWSSKEGDPLFWNARGAVQRFLAKLYQLAFFPVRVSRRVNLDFRSSTTLEHLYLYLKDMDALHQLYSEYGSQQEFFKALESTYISQILSEVRIRVKVRNADNSLTFRDLSEGEQQLLMVLGLLRFTKEDEALFLLDEPDTHLNPVWGIQYLEFMRQVVGEQETSQVLMSTHNPLVIASLESPQVKIMQRNEETGEVTAETPYENPRGMGVAAILTSDMFGLRSTLDLPTQRLMDERRELAVKETLTEEEIKRLGKLNDQLEGIDFSITMQDPLYHDFVQAMTRQENPAIRRQVEMTRQQREEQRQLTRSILRQLREREGRQE